MLRKFVMHVSRVEKYSAHVFSKGVLKCASPLLNDTTIIFRVCVKQATRNHQGNIPVPLGLPQTYPHPPREETHPCCMATPLH